MLSELEKIEDYTRLFGLIVVQLGSAVLKSGVYDAGEYPSSLIPREGSDQHRGWFQTSLLLS